MIHVYYCNPGHFLDLPGTHLLPPHRKRQMLRYRSLDDQVRCLAGGLLFRVALGAPACAQMRIGPHGKPYLESGPYFNLSHSGSCVALAVSPHPVGLDVEMLAPWRPRVAKRCFTPDELHWLAQQADPAAFFQLWTAKECIMKATGKGFALPPAGFSVLPVADGVHMVHGQAWFLSWRSIPDHALCVASSQPDGLQLLPLSRAQLLTPVVFQ